MRRQFIAGAIGWCALTSGSALGIDIMWIDPLGGLYSDRGNWGRGVPGTNDAAVFDLGAAYTVEMNASAIADRALVRNDCVTLLLSGSTLTLDNMQAIKPTLAVGEQTGDVGELHVQGGALTSSIVDVGVQPGSDGTLTVSGEDTTLTGFTQVRVGYQGTGSFSATGGSAVVAGTVSVGALSGSVGALTVDGAGTMWLGAGTHSVGKNGVGEMTVSGGATMESADAFVGQSRFADGTATVTGAGSAWTIIGSLDVGFDTTGELNILDGAVVTVSEFVSIGTLTPTTLDPPEYIEGTGVVRVLGEGSLLTAAGDILVPFLGIGTLEVGEGGRVATAGSVTSTNPGGTVRFILSEADEGGGPLLSASGAVTLNSSFEQVQFAEGYTGTIGAVYTIIDAGSITGIGQTLQVPPVNQPLEWLKVITATSVTLTILPGSADLDGDGDVDGADLGLLLGSWGFDDNQADLNGDDVVNGADLGLLLGAWSE